MEIKPGESIQRAIGFKLGAPIASGNGWTEFQILAACEKCGKEIDSKLLPSSNWDINVSVKIGPNSYTQVQYCPDCAPRSLRRALSAPNNRLPRWLHHWFAKENGYFWLPCPVCGKMFGGHERHGTTPVIDGRAKCTCGCNGFA